MPLSPAPLLPGQSPLPNPGERPADRRALRGGALVALVLLVAVLVPANLFLTKIVFFAPGLLARASDNQGAAGASAAFQGFVFDWSLRSSGQGGYTTPASLANMRSEARDFHMNTVVIPIYADMPSVIESALYWHASDNYANLDTLPDSAYIQAINDARAAGLEPVLELEVRQQDGESKPDERARWIGSGWYSQPSTQAIYINGTPSVVGSLERAWADNYSAFAVHFAQLAVAQHVHYFIIGDSLGNLTTDGPASVASADPQGLISTPGDDFNPKECTGRHECMWRHIIHAVRAATYTPYNGHKPQSGGNYHGLLLYAAAWEPAEAAGGSGPGEFEGIQFWSALDAVGIDAGFPLTQADVDVSAATLQAVWNGKGTGLAGQGDIFSRINQVADHTGKPVIFTAAGYESTPGANISPGRTAPAQYDPSEQLNDMQALIQTFSGNSWWAGVIWTSDAPLAPRSSQVNWEEGTQWAGDNLQPYDATSNPHGTKAAGIWLAQATHKVPVPCLC
jgi:hypothetical protein